MSSFNQFYSSMELKFDSNKFVKFPTAVFVLSVVFFLHSRPPHPTIIHFGSEPVIEEAFPCIEVFSAFLWPSTVFLQSSRELTFFTVE